MNRSAKKIGISQALCFLVGLALNSGTAVIAADSPIAADVPITPSVANNARNNAEVIKEYDKNIELHPENAELYASRAEVKLKLQDLDGAYNDASKALTLGPDNPVVLKTAQAVAHDLFLKGKNEFNWSAGVEYLSRAISLVSQKPDPYMYAHRGGAKLELNDISGALKDIDTAISLTPKDPVLYLARAEFRCKAKDLVGASADCDQAQQLNGDAAEVKSMRAQILQQSQQAP